MAESAEITNPDSEVIKVADQIMDQFYEIEAKVDELESIEATQFLIDTLERVVADLGGESLLEGREAG